MLKIDNNFITAITPTGDRPLAFALCQKWMSKQILKSNQWIVVDDGITPMKSTVSMQYIRRVPRPSDPSRTLIENLRVAIPLIKGNKIIFIEDDEYYAPEYIQTMVSKLDKYEIVGIGKSKYYHLLSGCYAQIGNLHHASLAEMGFRHSFLPEFIKFLDGGLYLDMRIWRTINRNRTHIFFDDNRSLYVGMKGMPGRHGIGGGHDINHKIYRNRLRDQSREILRKWIPNRSDYNEYIDIIRKNSNRKKSPIPVKVKISPTVIQEKVIPTVPIITKDITGITICYNTKELIERAYNSVRRFHPDMPIIIIDGSDRNNPCFRYVQGLKSDNTKVLSLGYNIGHGRGMHLGITKAKTIYALVFDSDIEMIKSPIPQMQNMMKEDMFGVGSIGNIGFDGYDYGKKPYHKKEGSVSYLHPVFQLININNYKKYHPYVHHGAPCYLTMIDIHKRNLSDKVLVNFPNLELFVRHYNRGTRNERKSHKLREIEGGWDYK